METKKLYIVMGETGEYSDRNDWPVCAFLDKAKAEEMVTLCEAENKRIETTYPERYGAEHDMRKAGDCHALDPNYCRDYTGTTYGIMETELRS